MSRPGFSVADITGSTKYIELSTPGGRYVGIVLFDASVTANQIETIAFRVSKAFELTTELREQPIKEPRAVSLDRDYRAHAASDDWLHGEVIRLRRIEELARAAIFNRSGEARDWPVGDTDEEGDALENLKRALRGDL